MVARTSRNVNIHGERFDSIIIFPEPRDDIYELTNKYN